MKTILHKFLSVFRTLGEVYAREFRTIRRDQGVVLFFLFLPLAYPVIYSLIYNRELVRDVPMVVVDHDRTQQSRDLVRRMDAAQGARLAGYAADLAEGRRAINEREAYAIMEIPEGFGRKIGRGEQASAQLYCETSLLLRYRSLLFSATEVALSMGADIQSSDIGSLGMAGLASGDPMPVVDGELGNLQSGFDSFIMPGVLILILQQCIVLAVGMMGRRTQRKSAQRPLHPGLRIHPPHHDRTRRLLHNHTGTARDMADTLCARSVPIPHGRRHTRNLRFPAASGSSLYRARLYRAAVHLRT